MKGSRRIIVSHCFDVNLPTVNESRSKSGDEQRTKRAFFPSPSRGFGEREGPTSNRKMSIKSSRWLQWLNKMSKESLPLVFFDLTLMRSYFKRNRMIFAKLVRLFCWLFRPRMRESALFPFLFLDKSTLCASWLMIIRMASFSEIPSWNWHRFSRAVDPFPWSSSSRAVTLLLFRAAWEDGLIRLSHHLDNVGTAESMRLIGPTCPSDSHRVSLFSAKCSCT